MTSSMKKMEKKEMPHEMDVKLKGISLVAVKGDRGDRGDPGRNPLTASKKAPLNPQVGDLWYQT